MDNPSARNGLTTDAASQVFGRLMSPVRALLHEIAAKNFEKALMCVGRLSDEITVAKSSDRSTTDDYLNDLYVLDRFADFFRAYIVFWENICQQEFHTAAWHALQDALDCLRLIKRFSTINVARFENQLTAVEQLFPYRYFLSCGFLVKGFRCCICGEDIDSDNCAHRVGCLYKGVVASGVAVVEDDCRSDHVGVVTNPRNKRLVLWLGEGSHSEAFRGLQTLSDALASGHLSPLDISGVVFYKRTRPNPQWVQRGRTDI